MFECKIPRSVPWSGLHYNVTFHQTQYELGNSSSVQSCSVNSSSVGSSCSVGVPLSGHTAYLAVQPLPETVIDWVDRIHVDTICGARIWMYVVISMCVMIGVVGISGTLIFLCVCVHEKRKKHKAPSVTE